MKLYDRRLRNKKPETHDFIVQMTTEDAEQLRWFLGYHDSVVYEDEGYESAAKLLKLLSNYLDNPSKVNPGWIGHGDDVEYMNDIRQAWYSR